MKRIFFSKRKTCYPIETNQMNNFLLEKVFWKSFVGIGDKVRTTFFKPYEKCDFFNFANLISALNLARPKRYFIFRPLNEFSTN
jgi:hypothetical protein